MYRYALQLSYDGTRYVGWQRQPRGESVQHALEAALRAAFGYAIALTGASRTDAGVHALAQIAHCNLRHRVPPEAFTLGLLPHLPRDILVRAAAAVPHTFHARHDALRKTYRYVVLQSAKPHLSWMGRAWCRHGKLNLRAMRTAARTLLGQHDFTTFCAKNDRAARKVRTLAECRVTRHCADQFAPLGERVAGELLIFHFTGSGFLKQMVRTIVGTLIDVGNGKRASNSFYKILNNRDRRSAGHTAPPEGLYLCKIEYAQELFARAATSAIGVADT